MKRIEGIQSLETREINVNNIKKPEINHQQFTSRLQEIKSEQVRGHLENLYNQIVSQSDKIKNRLHLSEVVKYKSLVREFLDVAVKHSHQFSKQNFLDRRGRHRVYSIIKNVDRELEALTKDFLNQEVDRISIIKRLDDIRGLLLDVFM
ncbi:YaaR family protein [Alkaliphilus serpentinus]|uniref:YaaR family protein n=1 Tax=Alkaliphilus serpentinus TaxID=1482731 RepID=A0A833MAE4_9FIRM|nr:YaaR family protein [Alkaliphilus serpentinus]KAB3532056.1 YaaR family protein [Alkaliphilus serpentinus]